MEGRKVVAWVWRKRRGGGPRALVEVAAAGGEGEGELLELHVVHEQEAGLGGLVRLADGLVDAVRDPPREGGDPYLVHGRVGVVVADDKETLFPEISAVQKIE